MNSCNNTILIIDEAGFSRICSALLESEGYEAETVSHCGIHTLNSLRERLRLIITSYPYCLDQLEEIRKISVPIIILSDHISNDLIAMLEGNSDTYCMIKPLDYQKFKSLINQTMAGDSNVNGGYNIV